MASEIQINKSKKSKTRKLPFLPRIGLYIDVAGYEVFIKNAPLGETLWNLYERGFSTTNLTKVAREQLKEIKMGQARTKTTTGS